MQRPKRNDRSGRCVRSVSCVRCVTSGTSVALCTLRALRWVETTLYARWPVNATRPVSQSIIFGAFVSVVGVDAGRGRGRLQWRLAGDCARSSSSAAEPDDRLIDCQSNSTTASRVISATAAAASSHLQALSRPICRPLWPQLHVRQLHCLVFSISNCSLGRLMRGAGKCVARSYWVALITGATAYVLETTDRSAVRRCTATAYSGTTRDASNWRPPDTLITTPAAPGCRRQKWAIS